MIQWPALLDEACLFTAGDTCGPPMSWLCLRKDDLEDWASQTLAIFCVWSVFYHGLTYGWVRLQTAKTQSKSWEECFISSHLNERCDQAIQSWCWSSPPGRCQKAQTFVSYPTWHYPQPMASLCCLKLAAQTFLGVRYRSRQEEGRTWKGSVRWAHFLKIAHCYILPCFDCDL